MSINTPVAALLGAVVLGVAAAGAFAVAGVMHDINNAPVGIPNIPIITPLVVVEYHEVEVTAPVQPGSYLVTPCEQEDSLNCYWDATRYNGEGVSFVNLNGSYFYAE